MATMDIYFLHEHQWLRPLEGLQPKIQIQVHHVRGFKCWYNCSAHTNTHTQVWELVPDVVLMAGVLSADEGHLDVLSAQRLLEGDLAHPLLFLQRPPGGDRRSGSAGRSGFHGTAHKKLPKHIKEHHIDWSSIEDPIQTL